MYKPILKIIYFFTVPPKSTVHNCPTQVIEGDDVTLHCNATGNPPPKVGWLRSRELLVSNGVNIISAINRNLSGIYECMAWNGLGHNHTANCSVDVHCK